MPRLASRAVTALTYACLFLLCLTTITICVIVVSGNHIRVTNAWTDRPTQVELRTQWIGLSRDGIVWGESTEGFRVPPSLPEELEPLSQHLRTSIGRSGAKVGRWSSSAWDLTERRLWRFEPAHGLATGSSSADDLPWALLLLALPATPLPFLLLRAYLRRRAARQRAKAGHCRTCAYDLTGNVSGVCPECGSALPRVSAPRNSHQ